MDWYEETGGYYPPKQLPIEELNAWNTRLDVKRDELWAYLKELDELRALRARKTGDKEKVVKCPSSSCRCRQ
ncbi:unnamed protein product, partial [Amoebophrya sp. A25]|eukprot:GSA25T00003722001.1